MYSQRVVFLLENNQAFNSNNCLKTTSFLKRYQQKTNANEKFVFLLFGFVNLVVQENL